ncbi:MAG: 50S ribosomal protein L29 [archaeon]
MAILRSKEIRQMKPAEVSAKLDELKQTLMEERSKLTAVGAADNPGKLREIRRTIARAETIRRESK